MKTAVFGVILLAFWAHSAAQASDVVAGERVFTGNACIGCHGEAGNSQVDIYPILAGRSYEFITEQLTNFRSRQRINA
ncbi:MAG: c-type cytochrome, partial [Pseudomonadota bacterium]